MRRARVMMMTAVLCGLPVLAAAQDDPRNGLVVSTPGGIGLELAISDRLAVRPEFTFSLTSSDSDGQDETNGTSVGVAVSAPYRVRSWDALHVYVSPRVAYSHSSNEGVSTSTDVRVDTTTTSVTVSGSLGVQYRLGDRFAVFGETGLGFSHSTSAIESSLLDLPDRTTTGVGTRSALGIVWYF